MRNLVIIAGLLLALMGLIVLALGTALSGGLGGAQLTGSGVQIVVLGVLVAIVGLVILWLGLRPDPTRSDLPTERDKLER